MSEDKGGNDRESKEERVTNLPVPTNVMMGGGCLLRGRRPRLRLDPW